MAECRCGYDSDWWVCIDGSVYGPCDDENCNGACEYRGDCSCACHRASATGTNSLAGEAR